MAAATSGAEAAGTVAISSRVAGLDTSSTSSDEAATQAPPIYNWNRGVPESGSGKGALMPAQMIDEREVIPPSMVTMVPEV